MDSKNIVQFVKTRRLKLAFTCEKDATIEVVYIDFVEKNGWCEEEKEFENFGWDMNVLETGRELLGEKETEGE